MNGIDQEDAPEPRVPQKHARGGDSADDSDKRARTCKVCLKTFSTTQHMRQHVDFKHADIQASQASQAEGASPTTSPMAAIDSWDAALMTSFAEMRISHHVPRDVVTTLKQQVAAQVASIHSTIHERLSGL